MKSEACKKCLYGKSPCEVGKAMNITDFCSKTHGWCAYFKHKDTYERWMNDGELERGLYGVVPAENDGCRNRKKTARR